MSDQPTAQPWTPERIAETMHAEHGVNWGPPPVESTWTEDWLAVDSDTGKIRELATPEELQDWMRQSAGGNTNFADPDFLAGLPRETPTAAHLGMTQAAMKEHAVPAEHRAQARWSARMDEGQARAASMARHPSMRPLTPRPVIR